MTAFDKIMEKKQSKICLIWSCYIYCFHTQLCNNKNSHWLLLNINCYHQKQQISRVSFKTHAVHFVGCGHNSITRINSIHLITLGLNIVSYYSIHFITLGLNVVTVNSIHFITLCLNVICDNSINFITLCLNVVFMMS